ncbi:MAG TPA: ribonuclease HI family protein [Patescibacteria group bacterium]
MDEKIIMYTDGGSRNNPGPAGIGVYIETLGKKYGEYIGTKTNNEAEYEALIFGLNKLKQLLGKDRAKKAEVVCYLDSELVVKQLNHEYKLKEERIQQYFLTIWNLMLEFKSVSFNHVLRDKNKIADALVNEALDAQAKQSPLL